MKWTIEPYQSFGALKYGMNRSETRAIITESPKTELMSDGTFPNDTYDESGLYVIFDKYNKFSAVEIEAPSEPHYQGKNLLQMPWSELINWFEKLDPELVISEKDFISYKLGISVFAPEKEENPNVSPTSITVFKKDHFNQKVGIPDPEQLDSFFIQPAFVEGVEDDVHHFKTLVDGLKNAFKNNREQGIFLWNRIPVSFNYTFDLPTLIPTLYSMLNDITTSAEGKKTYPLKCGSFESEWTVKWNDKYVLVDSHWELVKGSYSGALNQRNQLTLLKREFLAEWKGLLQQCHESWKLSGANLDSIDEVLTPKRLKSLEQKIQEYGKFYRPASNAILSTNRDGRKEFNLWNSPWYIRWVVSAAILLTVFLSAWYINTQKGDPFWMLESILTAVMYTFAIAIPIIAAAFFYYRWKARRKG